MTALLLASPARLDAQDRLPITMPSQVSLRGVVVDLPDGQFLGTRRVRPNASAPPAVYRWKQAVLDYDQAIDVATLRGLGIPAVDRSAFEFAENEEGSPRYQLRAVITNLRIEFGREAWVSVEWDLFDSVSGVIVQAFRSKGYAITQPGIGTWPQLDVVARAFDSATQELLEQQSFMAVLEGTGIPDGLPHLPEELD